MQTTIMDSCFGRNRNVLGIMALWSAFALSAAPSALAAEAEKPDPDKLNVTFGGFVDTYYGYDFNTPAGVDRTLVNGTPLGTNAVRSNEFNVNLAFIEAKLSADRVRGRFALQTGTSVQANYAGEAAGLGVVKGPVPAELMQEATVGYRLGEGLWVDGGIYLSHIGFESFISRDNWNYTRSLMAEYSPYYETGVKLSWQVSPLWSAQLHVLNGWQNIYETNRNKALGLQLSYTPTDRLTLTYNNFLGTEVGNQPRFFHDFIARVSVTDAVQLAVSVDVGSQVKAGNAGTSWWYAGTVFGKWQVAPKLSLGARVEEYSDRDQVIVTTGIPDGFRAGGASVNADVQLHKNLLWRNEVRGLFSPAAVFGGSSGPKSSDVLTVSSLGLSF